MPENSTNTLPVMEHFYTLQGEGLYTGVAAYFIRLGGCDVGCTWCDVKESWDKNAHTKRTITEIVNAVQSTPAQIAVITGGEPLMHDLTSLTAALQEAGIRTHIETSGTHPISGSWNWICFSPKRFKKPLDLFYEIADELKVVVFHKNDLRWAVEHGEKTVKKCALFVQPEWDNATENIEEIVSFVKQNPNWRLSLQTHKYLNIP